MCYSHCWNMWAREAQDQSEECWRPHWFGWCWCMLIKHMMMIMMMRMMSISTLRFCWLFLPLWDSVIVLCFAVYYFVSILVLQSSWWERSGSVVECLTRDREAAGSSLTASLRRGSWAIHIYPSLVLVQPRKTRPCLAERLLMGPKESNQTKVIILMGKR